MAKNGPITDRHQEYAAHGSYCMTKKGTLIGGIELDGRDPDGLNAKDFAAMSVISRSIYQNFPELLCAVTQYYIHVEGARVSLKKRENNVCDLLSKNRQRFLNSKNLSTSKIIHFFEIKPDENLNKLNPFTLLKHLALSFKRQSSREIITRCFSTEKSIMIYKKDLDRQRRELDDLLDEVKGRWENIFNCRMLDAKEIWAYFRFFANLDPELITDALSENIPAEQWDLLLAESDCFPVVINNQDYLKFQGVDNFYARMLAVTRYGEHEVSPGLWSAKAHSLTRQKGNYIIMTRFSPLSKIRQSLMFASKKKELQRKNLNFYDVFRGVGEQSGQAQGNDRYGNLKPVLKKKMQREGIFREMKLRRHYEKPSEKKAREQAEAVRRCRKMERKRRDRDGY